MKREDLEERTFGTIIASSDFPFYAAPEADAVMDAMEARIKELESMLKDKDGIMGTCRGLIESANVMHKDAEDKLLNCIKKLEAKASEDYISYQRKVQKQAKRIAELESENERLKAKTENMDERREYAYEMDIVIRWLDKNEDFVTEPNGKMQLLKSKAMHQKIKWLDEHPRTPTTEESSATERAAG